METMRVPHLYREHGEWTCFGAGLFANGHTPYRAWCHWKIAIGARRQQMRAMRALLIDGQQRAVAELTAA